LRQAVSAVLECKSLEDYAKNHNELSRALEKFAKK
jgi:ribulose 1,5-bisphosphate carboxylase large subunit-like protein